MGKTKSEAPAQEPQSLIARLRSRFARRQMDAGEQFHELAASLATGRGKVPDDDVIEQVLAAANKTPEDLADAVALNERVATLRAQVQDDAVLRQAFDAAHAELRDAQAERDEFLQRSNARLAAADAAVTSARTARDRASKIRRELQAAEDALDARRFGGEYVEAAQAARRDARRAQDLPQQLEHRIARVRQDLAAFRAGDGEHPRVPKLEAELRELQEAVPAVQVALARGDHAGAIAAAAVQRADEREPAAAPPHPVFDNPNAAARRVDAWGAA